MPWPNFSPLDCSPSPVQHSQGLQVRASVPRNPQQPYKGDGAGGYPPIYRGELEACHIMDYMWQAVAVDRNSITASSSTRQASKWRASRGLGNECPASKWETFRDSRPCPSALQPRTPSL